MNADWIALSPTPLDVGAASAFVNDERCGGTAIFIGSTRAQSHPQFGSLIALKYEAYQAMADRQLRDLAARARASAEVLKLAILHRLGEVPLGEASVVIAVSTPHRAEAFAVCRWIIDTLKTETAIWKQEIWSSGQTAWLHPEGNVVS